MAGEAYGSGDGDGGAAPVAPRGAIDGAGVANPSHQAAAAAMDGSNALVTGAASSSTNPPVPPRVSTEQEVHNLQRASTTDAPMQQDEDEIWELYNVTRVDALVSDGRWDILEKCLSNLIKKIYPNPLRTHPMLFLHVKRGNLLEKITKRRLEEARIFLDQEIRTPFKEVVDMGQSELPFASIQAINDEIDYCARCVAAGTREEHPYCNSNEVIKVVLRDYFSLYITEQTKFDVPTIAKKKWWRFAVKITPSVPK